MFKATPSSDAPDGATAGLPVLPPLAAIVEIVFLVVLPGLLDLFVPGFPSLNEMQPHFYWLPVLLLTLQYGSASGLLAAGAAIVLASTLGWPEQEIGENHFTYQLRIWLQPVLWVATAVILGQLRLRQIERKQALGRSVAELMEQRQALATHAGQLRERCSTLETFIATRHQAQPQALLAALGRAQSAVPDDARTGLGDAFSLAFGACQASVLVLEGQRLVPAFRHAAADAPAASPIVPDSELFLALVRDGHPLSVLDAASERLLAGHALVAVPMFGLSGQPAGAVLLEACSPDLLDTDTPKRLAAIAAAISVHVARRAHPRDDQSAALVPLSSEPARAGGSRLPHWRRVRRGLDRAAATVARSLTGKA